jgi:amino acid adenylation domain-containing protein
MSISRALYQLLSDSAQRSPKKAAVEEADGNSIDYQGLSELAAVVAGWLSGAGVSQGDRVAIYLHKSIDSVASIFGVLQCGATYVPLDPLAPASRNAYILSDCMVSAVVTEGALLEPLQRELAKYRSINHILVLNGVGGGEPLRAALERVGPSPVSSVANIDASSDLAYILYTSGSTGMPKGVMITHENALRFIDWCSDVFQPTASDRFSSHAPFHFDLSIHDLYVPIKHGATVILIDEGLGKDPLRLAQKIAEKRISIWYSAPSILGMLVQQGRLEEHDWSALKKVLFAGEVFPIKHLRALKQYWPLPSYYNLYGPTETNVCTWLEVPRDIPADRTDPFPIGRVCAHYRDRVINTDCNEVPDGSEGELCIAGLGIMRGYWNLADQNEKVFFVDPDGTRWYRTGDIVMRDSDGNFRFLGRRDRMIKKRGYRVELGEIEAALYRHADVKEAAVIAKSNDDGPHVRAFLSTRDGERLSIIALKQFCAKELPLYMVPDTFSFLDRLPTTSTDKIDYQKLKDLP